MTKGMPWRTRLAKLCGYSWSESFSLRDDKARCKHWCRQYLVVATKLLFAIAYSFQDFAWASHKRFYVTFAEISWQHFIYIGYFCRGAISIIRSHSRSPAHLQSSFNNLPSAVNFSSARSHLLKCVRPLCVSFPLLPGEGRGRVSLQENRPFFYFLPKQPNCDQTLPPPPTTHFS